MSGFRTIYAFGDSLSDAGNAWLLTNSVYAKTLQFSSEPVSPPYFQEFYSSSVGANVFSNGPVWTQDLASMLNLGTLAPSGVGAFANTVQEALSPSVGATEASIIVASLELSAGVSGDNPYIQLVAGVAGGNDFAVGGAVTGPTGENAALSGLDDLSAQLDTFKRNVPTPKANALATVSIGGNDVLNILEDTNFGTLYGAGTTLADVAATQAGQDIAQSVSLEASFLGSLVALGVKNVAVINTPDIGKTPEAAGLGAAQAAAGTVLSEYYNNLLATDVASLDSNGAKIVIGDAFGLIDAVTADPAPFGLTNVTTPVYSGGLSSFNAADLVSSNPSVQNTYLFFDKEHPTETGELGLAQLARAALTNTSITGLLGGLNLSQQLELIYVAYDGRAADGGGLTYWTGQDILAQSNGQSAVAALNNIANAFAPQPESIALYPFLGSSTPPSQAQLTSFIAGVYNNLFGRAADTAGSAYWAGQISDGAVGPGEAALAIANGATGADAIEAQNKVTVAQDFTTRTEAANLGELVPLPSSFLTAARGVLSGVDGASLNDASVTAAMSATSAYIANPGSTQTMADALTVTPLIVSASNSVVNPGAGSASIQFLAGTSGDTLVLAPGVTDQVSGFDPGSDVLNFGALLSAANVDLSEDLSALGNYVTVVDQRSNALIDFDPAGHGGGSTVAVLQGLGSSVTSLDSLLAHGTVRIA